MKLKDYREAQVFQHGWECGIKNLKKVLKKKNLMGIWKIIEDDIG